MGTLNQQSPYYPYPPRPGIGLEEVRLDAAHARLSDAETEQVLDFEHNLYGLSLDATAFPSAAAFQSEQAELGAPLQPLEAVWELKVHSPQLGVNYFMTEKGKSALRTAVGIECEAETAEDVAVVLASLDISSINSKVLDELEADSVGYEEALLGETFKAHGFSGEYVPAPRLVNVHKNPDVLVARAWGYRQLKTYLQCVKADLGAGQTEAGGLVTAAELVVINKYRQRINEFLASNYVSANELLAQYRTSGEKVHGEVIKKLEDILPAFSSRMENARIASFLQRLDRYRQGVAIAEDGTFTWLSSSARSLLTREKEQTETVRADRGLYADIDPELLESTSIDGMTFGRLLADVLREYKLFSSVEEWDSERPGPASDNKWQVIVDDKFKSLGVDDRQRVVKVPAKPTTLMTAVSVGNHEITHVLQHENKRAVGKLAILGRIGLDNVSEQTESGGKWQEEVARQALSGEVRNDIAGTGYYKNLEIKARGGSFGECVEAYYDDLLQRNPKMKTDTAVAQAVNRARRVFRSGGFEFAQDTTHLTNTQPLNYLEQRLIFEGLNDETRKYLLVGGISIANLVELSQYGLVDTDNIHIPTKMPWQVMYSAVKALLSAYEQSALDTEGV